MLRRLAFLTLIGAFAFAGAAAQEQKAWHKFKSEAGRFSVNIPCEPEIKTENIENGHGTSEQIYHSCGDDDGYFLISYIDLDIAQGNNSLDKFRDGIIKGSNGTLVSETSRSLGSNPGRAIVANGRTGTVDVIYNFRIYLIGKRLYCIGAVNTKDNSRSPSIDKFLSSFMLEK